MIKSLINNKKNKKRKAFTLIELIIVICIIAILAAIAIPKFLQINENAKLKSDISNGQNISNAVSALIADEKIDVPTADKKFYLQPGGTLADEAKETANYMDNIPVVKSKKVLSATDNKDRGFSVVVTKDGNIKVYVGNSNDASNIVYPASEVPSSSPYYSLK